MHTDVVIASYDEWLDGLDAEMRDEAWYCLITGSYSRRLLESLRRDGPVISPRERGLDAPEKAQAGEPLGANLQTFLRERLARLVRQPAGS